MARSPDIGSRFANTPAWREERMLLPEGLKQFLHDSMIRIGGVALLVVAGFLLLSLLSYTPLDPSWNNIASGAPLNRAGVWGARIADLMLQWLGLVSFLAPVCLTIWGVRIVWNLRLPWGLTRPVALLLALPLLALGLAISPPGEIWPLRSGLGGAAGDGLNVLAVNLLGLTPLPVAVPAFVINLLALGLALPLAIFALALSAGQWRWTGRKLLAFSSVAFYQLARLSAFVRSKIDARATQRRTSIRRHDLDMAPPLRRKSSVSGASGDTLRKQGPVPPIWSDPPRPERKRIARDDIVEPKTKRAAQADQSALDLGRVGDYQLPPLNILSLPQADKARRADPLRTAESDEALEANARMLETVLADFGIKGEILNVRPGPVVTLYELEPAPGIKSARVIGLADDIARSMSAISARVAVIPGRNAIGIELPNQRRETVYLRELLASPAYENTAARLTLALGKTIGGECVIADLAAMPHLLIAGTTGAGKSVAINTMILSLLYRMPPEQCKFIMIDPKMLELSMYDGIPHLLAPVVTDPGKAIVALKWAVREMEDRYRKMSRLGVRSIAAYNQRVAVAEEKGEVLRRTVQTGFDPNSGQPLFEEQEMDLDPLPFIVVIVDEMADLMMVAGKDIEGAVQRLAQMARAAGIHLIMATQRPSVDVITGTIKANFPTRISFQVTSKIDSRTILGEQGAEQLLGQGDMLYMAGGGRITRVHGPYVSDEEVERAVGFLKTQGAPAYLDEITDDEFDPEITADMMGMAGDGENALYDKALVIVAQQQRVSTSLIQRHLRIGYNRAARIVEEMEEQGVISRPNHSGKRDVLVGER